MKHFGIEVKTSATNEEAKVGEVKGAVSARLAVRTSAMRCSASCHSGIRSAGHASSAAVPSSATSGHTSLYCMGVSCHASRKGVRWTVRVSQKATKAQNCSIISDELARTTAW